MANSSINHAPIHAKPKTFQDLRGAIGPIKWLWPKWLPKGFLTIVAGESGSGKSELLLRIAACITNGYPWPDMTPASTTPGSVVWCEAEAAQAMHLERAVKWGMNLDRLIIPLEDPLQDISLGSADHRKAIEQAARRPDVKLIIVDSLSGSNTEEENSTKILPIIKFLAESARNTGKSFLLSHHLRKKSQSDGDTVDLGRLRGSSSIAQLARVIWVAGDPDLKSGLKRLRVIKSNLAAFPNPIAFGLDDNGVHFEEAVNPAPIQSEKDKAIKFLRDGLSSGPLAAKTISEQAATFGIHPRTLMNAKKALSIRSSRNGGKGGSWVWSLPS